MPTTKRALLIEDEPFICEMYSRAFVDEGYTFDVAMDGEEGVQKADQADYEIILLDIMLPKKNGLDVLRDLRADGSRTKHTPILLLTNLGQESVIRDAYNLGADGFLLKSSHLPRQVYDKVQDFLQGRLRKEDMLTDTL